MPAMPSAAGAVIRHADQPVGRSPSGLPMQDLISSACGSTALYTGQQWLQPGERVLLHTHPVEEVLIFLAGSGHAMLGDRHVEVRAGTSLHIPAGLPHGFRNTGQGELRLFVIFPTPDFALTTIVEAAR